MSRLSTGYPNNLDLAGKVRGAVIGLVLKLIGSERNGYNQDHNRTESKKVPNSEPESAGPAAPRFGIGKPLLLFEIVIALLLRHHGTQKRLTFRTEKTIFRYRGFARGATTNRPRLSFRQVVSL
jgi:hypothetical protein